MPDGSVRDRPAEPEDLGRLFLRRPSAGDVDGVVAGGATAEIARRQPDGTWLWVADQPQVAG